MKKFAILSLLLVLSSFSMKAYAQDPLQEGMGLLEKSDCTGALPLLRRAVAEKPNSERANLYLGNAFLCLKTLDSAEIYLSKAVSLDNELAPAYYGLGQVYMAQKKYTEALKNYNQAIGYDSKNEEYVISLGNAYIAADSLDPAMQAFYKARDMNDKDPRALAGIADVYSAQNIYDPAIENYKDALKIDSTNIEVRLKLANAYMKNSDGADAYEQFLKVSELSPNNPQGQYQAGDLLYVNKRYKEAFPFLKKYHDLVPADQKALYELADCAYNGHLFTDAVKYYQEYISKNPNSMEAKKSLAASYYFEKQAVESYNLYKSIPIDSMNVRELVRYGLAANAVHDTSTTIMAWSRAVKLDTTLSEIEYFLANTLFSDRQYGEAIVHFQKRLAMDSTDVAARLNMGLCYFIIQNYQDAVSALRKVVEQKPDNYQGNLWLARALIFDDSLEAAKDIYQGFIKIATSDTSADHSTDLNEAYRQTALYEIITGSKMAKDHPDDAKKLYEDALKNLMTAIKYDAKESKTHALLAQDYALMGKIDEACKEIKIVLKTDPKNDQMIKLQKSLGCQ
jgi:tetratricopeptide (TPR) repeat protein